MMGRSVTAAVPVTSFSFPCPVLPFMLKWRGEGRTACQEASVLLLTLLGFVALSQLRSLWVLSVCVFFNKDLRTPTYSVTNSLEGFMGDTKLY